MFMLTKKFFGLVLVFIFIFSVSIFFGKNSVYEQSYNKILENIDYNSTNEHDVLLLLSRTYAAKYGSGKIAKDKLKLENILSRLEETAYLNSDDKIGWGLSFAWDAFNDGTVNPEDTIYAYTTAHAGLAFIDAYEVTNNEHYIEVATKAARTLLDDTCCWIEGENTSIWYSNQPQDQLGTQYVVHNTNALTISLLKRLGKHGEIFDQTERLFLYLLSQQGANQESVNLPEWDWRYGLMHDNNNDLIHLMFIVDALLQDSRTQDLAHHILEEAGKYFFDKNGIPLDETKTLGSLGWGPPAYLFYTACQDGFEWRTKQLADYIASEINKTDLSIFDDSESGLRKLAWDALGLVKYDSCD